MDDSKRFTTIEVRGAERPLTCWPEDAERLSQYRWRQNPYTGEVLCKVRGKLLNVCEFLGIEKVEDQLDLTGAAPKVRSKAKTSRYKGVHRHEGSGKWRASWGDKEFSPLFDTEEEAAQWRKQKVAGIVKRHTATSS